MDSGGRGRSTDETRQKEESTQPITALLRSSGGKQDAHVIQYTPSGFVFLPTYRFFSHPGGLKFGFFSELWCGGKNSPGEEILSEPNKEFELTSVISVSQAPSIFKNLVIWLQGDYQWLQSDRSWTDFDQFVWQTRVHVEGSVNVPQTWEKYSMASKMLTFPVGWFTVASCKLQESLTLHPAGPKSLHHLLVWRLLWHKLWRFYVSVLFVDFTDCVKCKTRKWNTKAKQENQTKARRPGNIWKQLLW